MTIQSVAPNFKSRVGCRWRLKMSVRVAPGANLTVSVRDCAVTGCIGSSDGGGREGSVRVKGKEGRGTNKTSTPSQGVYTQPNPIGRDQSIHARCDLSLDQRRCINSGDDLRSRRHRRLDQRWRPRSFILSTHSHDCNIHRSLRKGLQQADNIHRKGRWSCR